MTNVKRTVTQYTLADIPKMERLIEQYESNLIDLRQFYNQAVETSKKVRGGDAATWKRSIGVFESKAQELRDEIALIKAKYNK